MRQTASVLEDLLDDSEIIFEPPNVAERYFSDPEHTSDVDVESDEDVTVRWTTKTLTPTKITPENSDKPVSKLKTPLKSNRTVTRDLRSQEFKELIREEKKTNELLEELIDLKREKYQFMGIIP